MNYFELFNLPQTLECDKQQLSQAYQALQQLTHPDKFAADTEQAQRLALQKNSLVNDGYSILRHPLSRAQHLLALRGIELNGEQQTLQDTSFLMQQLEWREALAEAEQDEDALHEFADDIEHEIQTYLTRLQTLFAETELQDHTDHNQTIAQEIRKLTFIYKFQTQIEHHLEELEE